MPFDQPQYPRIRTKLMRMNEKIDDDFFRILERLRNREISVEKFQKEALAFFENIHLSKEFASDIAIAASSDEQHWLVRRHTDNCRYTILFYRVNENEAQPPHQHHNLVSTQVVVSGKIHLREYERVDQAGGGNLKVRLVRDAILGPGDVIQASEWSRNVHWFSGEGGPAVIFQMNARGYEDTVFNDDDEGPYGRRYLDPTNISRDGLVECETLDTEEAFFRFKSHSLGEYPIPPAADEGTRVTIAI
jgi:hypothetical protein